MLGAGGFILFFTVMQVGVDKIIWGVEIGPWIRGFIQRTLVVSVGVAGSVFIVSAIIGEAIGQDYHPVMSVAAIAEYLAFIIFICLNLQGAALMSHVAKNYEPTEKGPQWIYVPKKAPTQAVVPP